MGTPVVLLLHRVNPDKSDGILLQYSVVRRCLGGKPQYQTHKPPSRCRMRSIMGTSGCETVEAISTSSTTTLLRVVRVSSCDRHQHPAGLSG